MSKPKQTSEETLKFYDEVREMLRGAGSLKQKNSLRANVLNPETNWKREVRDPFYKYYGGDVNRLEDSIRATERELRKCIKELNGLCFRAGVMPVRKPEILIDFLMDADRRNFYRRAIQRHEKRDTVVSIQDLEREFRHRHTK